MFWHSAEIRWRKADNAGKIYVLSSWCQLIFFPCLCTESFDNVQDKNISSFAVTASFFFMGHIKPQQVLAYCSSHSECTDSKRSFWSSSWASYSCLREGDCGQEECCRSYRCTNVCSDQCQSNADCNFGKFCCKKSDGINECQSSCLRETCSETFNHEC